MTTPLILQEVYLLERYSSLEYFALMRDQWEEMVNHVEQCLNVFMEHLPLDYRSRQRSQQPDIVWGEHVLPNFRSTLQNINRSYIRLSHGDLNALAAANGVITGQRGQSDFWPEWMDEQQVSQTIPNALDCYYDLLNAPQILAGNISHTVKRTWTPGSLSHDYVESTRGSLDPPERWPRYRLNSNVRVESGKPVPRSGIYLPDTDNSCAALLIEGANWDDARVLPRTHDVIDEEGKKFAENPIAEWRSTGWTLVERVPGETVSRKEGLGAVATPPQHVAAGEPCPQSGWWFTPAKPDSRRHFQTGDVFPVIEGSGYGATFWQWSSNQSFPRLL